MGEGAESVKHARVFLFELVGAADTAQGLVAELREIAADIGGDIPHRIVKIESREFHHGQFGTVGHRYTVTVSVLR
jgi:hypothetical protein